MQRSPCWDRPDIFQLRRDKDLSPVHSRCAATKVQPRIHGMQLFAQKYAGIIQFDCASKRQKHPKTTEITRTYMNKLKTSQRSQKHRETVILRYEWLVPKCKSALVALSCQVGFTVPPHYERWSSCRPIGDWIVFSGPGKEGFLLPSPLMWNNPHDWATKIDRSS